MQREVYEYISNQTNDPIVEWKACAISGKEFAIFQSDLDFYAKISPNFGGKKYKIPTPTLCPDCRAQRGYAWRNHRSLYKRKCDASGKDIISLHRPETPFLVYHNKNRWGDSWNASDFGKKVDFDVSIFEQIYELQKKVPRMHRFTYAEDRMLNSEYTNCAGDLKNCYLVFATGRCENSYYADYLNDCDECMDILVGYKSTKCYQCSDIENCYGVFYSQDCLDCKDSYYLNDCVNCRDCIACVGLRGQQYYILNQGYTKQEYQIQKEKIIKTDSSFEKSFLKKYMELQSNVPKKYMQGNNTENVVGDFINNSKNVYYAFDTNNAEDVKYVAHFMDGKYCMDFSDRGESELCYEISGGGDQMYKCLFSTSVYGCTNSLYCDLCFYCHDCFGCIGLKNQRYCILNKQYTKEEYGKLVPKIIQHMQKISEWGELPPVSMSMFCYNEALAQEHYPLTKEEALARGYKWMDKEYPVNVPDGMEMIEASELETNLGNGGRGDPYDESILNKAIICEKSGKPFRIVKPELEFYRKHNLPLPRKHPDVRYMERMRQRPGRELYLRKCDKCGKEMLSVYDENSEFKVYCESCYNKEIYG